LILLRYADVRFTQVQHELGPSTGRREIGKDDYQGLNVMFVPHEVRRPGSNPATPATATGASSPEAARNSSPSQETASSPGQSAGAVVVVILG
jgi:hypothetical protein